MVHSNAAAQTSDGGKALNVLYAFGGRLYAGYGDYGANTGPIHLKSVPTSDPTGAWTDHLTISTEQIAGLRPLGDGRLVVPNVDPRGSGPGGYAELASGVWTDLPARIGAAAVIHAFDMYEFGGSLWACGADDTGASVWRSTDAGATWAESLVGPAGGFNRFYGFIEAGGELRVSDPVSGTTYLWSGSAWVEDAVNPLPAGFNGGPGVAWNDGYLIPQDVEIGRSAQSLAYFDGTSTTVIATGISGFSIGDDDALYVLHATGIRRAPATSPITFTVVGLVDGIAAEKCAICILPGSTQAAIGRTDSRIEVVTLP